MEEKFDKEVKCVVWDLDNTIWNGTLLESGTVNLRPRIREIFDELDSRGVLQSIASKNNFDDAMNTLRQMGIEHYFLYPEINWNPKSDSIVNIRRNLDIGMDTILFIDDDPFERDEVTTSLPEVESVDALRYLDLLGIKRCNPRFITDDSKRRRSLYMENIRRNKEEEEFKGPKEEFLASLNMKFIITEAEEGDLMRAEELTVRTNQLNATGRTYDYDELRAILQSEHHKLYVCDLSDKYGSYGKIGLALVEINSECWFLRMLLMSCRVISRSVGSVLLTYIMRGAKQQGKRLLADFVQTERNRKMYATYKFSNFNEVSNDGKGNIVFENNLAILPEFPKYIDILLPDR
jgi:FkbH-like protein